MAREIKPNQDYRGKLLKLIPSEIVAAYMALQGVVPENSAKWGLTIVAILLLLITPFYLRIVEKVKGKPQIVFSTISFIVWLYSLGGPFRYFDLYQPWIATIVLVLWTMLIPVFLGSGTPGDNS